MTQSPECQRCGKPVVASAADYDVFEHMHYVCFHYEFEHPGDPDTECVAGGCPASGVSLPSRLVRTDGVDISQAGNTVVPAIAVLQELGYRLEQVDGMLVATAGRCRFVAEDPVAILGLVKLAELRGREWRADDAEIDRVLSEFDL